MDDCACVFLVIKDKNGVVIEKFKIAYVCGSELSTCTELVSCS